MMKNTELHTHSYYSDGQMSPTEIVRLAKKRKIKNLALTDHNSIKGVNEAIKEGKKLGVNIIPAVEFVAKEDEVLGYFIDIKNKQLNKVLSESRKRIESKIRDCCKKLGKKGYEISFKGIQKKFPKAKGNINEFYPYHILSEKGYGNFLEIKSILKKQGIKSKKIKYVPIEKAIKIILKAGGVPVLAHPWVNEESRGLLKENNFKKLIKAGLKGIEIDNGDRDERYNKKIINRIKTLAKRYNLIITSGSDFHGKIIVKLTKTHQLGKFNCDEKVVEQLKEVKK